VKFLGVKDFAAFQALNEFCVFVSGDDSYPGVFASGRHRFAIKRDWMSLSADCSGLFSNFKLQN
jgi:hypothetical protein